MKISIILLYVLMAVSVIVHILQIIQYDDLNRRYWHLVDRIDKLSEVDGPSAGTESTEAGTESTAGGVKAVGVFQNNDGLPRVVWSDGTVTKATNYYY